MLKIYIILVQQEADLRGFDTKTCILKDQRNINRYMYSMDNFL